MNKNLEDPCQLGKQFHSWIRLSTSYQHRRMKKIFNLTLKGIYIFFYGVDNHNYFIMLFFVSNTTANKIS